jgi:hypothetical protein
LVFHSLTGLSYVNAFLIVLIIDEFSFGVYFAAIPAFGAVLIVVVFCGVVNILSFKGRIHCIH